MTTNDAYLRMMNTPATLVTVVISAGRGSDKSVSIHLINVCKLLLNY